MSNSINPLHHIADLIESKCAVKQQAFRNLEHLFDHMRGEARKLIEEILDHAKNTDKDITLEIANVSNNEFHLKIAGDLLVFILHSNIVTTPDKHGFSTSPYVMENSMRKYLGQINVYNFMSDSFKYNRGNDPGYLIARLFINFENHFFVEGDGQMNFMFEPVSEAPITSADVSIFLQLAISQALDSDLVTPPFPSIRQITLNQKMERSANMGMGTKIGFQMSFNNTQE
jgi:hypothetical protein